MLTVIPKTFLYVPITQRCKAIKAKSKSINQIGFGKTGFYIGGGAINANCSAELIELAEKLQLPVVSTLMGLGAFPETHKQSVGMLGMHGTYEANKVMHNSDVIFAVGVRFDDRTTNNLEKYCPNATVIQIDVDPTSISKQLMQIFQLWVMRNLH